MQFSKLRGIFRIVDSCLEVGADPDIWRRHLVDEARQFFRAPLGLSGEFSDIYSTENAIVHHHVDAGWPSPDSQRHFIRYQIEGAHRHDPLRAALVKRAASFTCTSADALIGIDSFRQSSVYRDYMAPSGCDDQLIGIHDYRSGKGVRWQTLTLIRATGEPLFTRDDRKALFLLLREIRRHMGGRLADTSDPVASLTPRLREAFDALLSGDRERDSATRLGVSTGTFHKYVTAIYRHFDVSGRAELQALFVRGFRPDRKPAPADARAARLRREGAPMSRPWRAGESVLKQSRPL